MEKLPLLQKILKRFTREKECIIISNECFSGVNFILMVNKEDKDDENFINSIKKKFNSFMENDYYLNDVIKILEKHKIYVDEYFWVNRTMFVLFKKGL